MSVKNVHLANVKSAASGASCARREAIKIGRVGPNVSTAKLGQAQMLKEEQHVSHALSVM